MAFIRSSSAWSFVQSSRIIQDITNPYSLLLDILRKISLLSGVSNESILFFNSFSDSSFRFGNFLISSTPLSVNICFTLLISLPTVPFLVLLSQSYSLDSVKPRNLNLSTCHSPSSTIQLHFSGACISPRLGLSFISFLSFGKKI